MSTPHSSEERVWAALSHLSALAFGMGILLPIIGWSEKRGRSNYAAFQSLQALGYQSLGYTIWLLSYLVVFVVVLVVIISMSFQAEKTGKSFNPFTGTGMLILFVVFGFLAIYFLLPIIASIACGFGKDFRYPIMGNRLAHYLEYDSAQKPQEQRWLNEDHEFRWVVAMGHFSILIMLWGMLAPLTTWILHGKRSLFLKFQSIQTIVYQAGTTLFYFAGLFIYLFSLLLLFVGLGMSGKPNFDSSQGLIGILGFGISLFISIALILIVPFLHILGQWAGYRVLKGDNYRYPLIGKLIEKRVVEKTALVENASLGQKGETS